MDLSSEQKESIENKLLQEYSDLKKQYSEEGNKLISAYIGNVSQNVIISVSLFTERQLELQGESKRVVKNVCNVAIEMLQNILFHAEVNEEGFHLSYFIIGYTDDQYLIRSCNHIKVVDVPYVRNRLDEILEIDKKGLNKLYINKLTKGEMSAKGKAGLGIITIALNSDEHIEYEIQDLNTDYSMLKLTARINC